MGEITIGVVFAWVVLLFLGYLAFRGAKRLFVYVGKKTSGRSLRSLERIEKLVALRDAGALTQAEFEAEKAKILN